MKSLTCLSIIVAVIVALFIGSAAGVDAHHRPTATPRHHATATRTIAPTLTQTPSNTPVPATATKRSTSTALPTARCYVVKTGTQYGTPYVEWHCTDYNGNQFGAVEPPSVTPNWP